MTVLAPAPVQAEHFPDELAVVVSIEDIQRGRPEDAAQCALARALGRLDLGFVVVGFRGVYFGDAMWLRECAEYALPREAQQWIADFDARKPVHPERFLLRRCHADSGTGAARQTQTAGL